MIRRIAPSAGLVSLLLLVGCSRPDATSGVEKDVGDAVKLLAESAEKDTAAIQQAFALIKKHPNAASLKALVSWLDSSIPERRRAAIHALQSLSWDDPSPAFPRLRELLAHSEGKTRGMAALALASQGDHDSYDPILAMVTRDSDGYARRCAAWTLGEFGDARALATLRRSFRDRDPGFRQCVQNSLERITFLEQNKDIDAEAETVIRGVWLLSGSPKPQAERLNRALQMIRACPEPRRRALLEVLTASQLISIQNAATLALSQLEDPGD
jgi:HEAT repeat protein